MKYSLVMISAALLLGGCTAVEEKEVNLDDVAKQMIAQYYDETTMMLADEDQSAGLLMLDMSANTCVYYVSTNNDTNELALCQGDGEAIQKAFEARRQYDADSAKNYFPEQVEKIENGIIKQLGDTWVLIIADDSEAVQNSLSETLN